MTREQEFHELMESLFRRSGEATGYWPNYFLRDVRKSGGLAVARKLLAPGTVASGFDRLIEVRRADLSVEALALSKRFRPLFSEKELAEACNRLKAVPTSAFPELVERAGFAGEVEPDSSFPEGAVRQVTVNQYERSKKAREACLREHGARCSVCEINFEEIYGEIGRGFIHVHHTRPLSRIKETYQVDPKKDLVPVCPNCHAMLHRREPPFDIEQLRSEMRAAAERFAGE